MGDAWRLGPYRALSHCFVVEGIGAEPVRSRLDDALAPLAIGAPQATGSARDEEAAGVSVRGGRIPTYRVESADEPDGDNYRVLFGRATVGTGTAWEAAGLVLWHVNQRAVGKDRARHLLLHAAGAEREGVLVLILGASGYGKTTTVSALLQSGYRYLTDEAVALDRQTLRTTAFPKALAINSDVLARVAPQPRADDDPVLHARWWDLGSPGVVPPTSPGLVVVLRPLGGTSLPPGSPRRLTAGQAAVEIADSTFEFPNRPESNLRAAARLASRVPCYEIARADLTTMRSTIDALVAETARSAGSSVAGGARSEQALLPDSGPADDLPQTPSGSPEEEATMSLAHVEVDPTGRYAPLEGLTTVRVGTEAIVHNPATDLLHRLDPTASVVWDLLDGTVPLEQLVHEVAEAYSAPVEVVRADLHALIERLLDDELIADSAGVEVQVGAPSAGEDVEDPLGEPDDTARVLSVPPSACYDASAGLGWVATDAIQVGPLVLGVRSDTDATRAAVRSTLAPWLVEGFDVDANFSVREPTQSAPGAQWSPAQVFTGCTLIGRHRELSSAIDQLLAEIVWRLAHASDRGPSGGQIWVGSGAVVPPGGPSRAVLVPRGMAASWPVGRDMPRLAVTSGVFLDPDAGVVLLPTGGYDESAAGESQGPVVALDPRDAGWSRVPVRGWLLPGAADSSEGGGPGELLMAVLRLIHARGDGVGEALASMSVLANAVPIERVRGGLSEAQRVADAWLAPEAEPIGRASS